MKKESILRIYTIYERPQDYPQGYVVRRFLIVGGNKPVQDDTFLLQSENLDTCREFVITMGLTKLDRSPEDPPEVLENWI